MHYAQQEMVKVLDRAAHFAKEFAPLLGALPVLDSLAEVRQALLSTASDQYGAGKASVAGTVTKGELRERLRAHHLVPLSRFALTRREEIPVLKMEKFRVPPRGATDVSLLAAAGAMAKLAEEYYPLIRGDLGNDFLDRLQAATKAFHEAIISRDNLRAQHGRATGPIDISVKRARKVVDVLTSAIESRLVARPELVAEWKRRVRIPKKPGVPQGAVRKAAALAAAQLDGQAASPDGGALRIA